MPLALLSGASNHAAGPICRRDLLTGTHNVASRPCNPSERERKRDRAKSRDHHGRAHVEQAAAWPGNRFHWTRVAHFQQTSSLWKRSQCTLLQVLRRCIWICLRVCSIWFSAVSVQLPPREAKFADWLLYNRPLHRALALSNCPSTCQHLPN